MEDSAMNESKKIVSYTVQVKHRYLLNGLAWIVAGIFLIIPFKIFTMMSTVCIIATLYLKTMDFRKNKEEAETSSKPFCFVICTVSCYSLL